MFFAVCSRSGEIDRAACGIASHYQHEKIMTDAETDCDPSQLAGFAVLQFCHAGMAISFETWDIAYSAIDTA
ncbi:hypothetical protein CU041_19300 [Thalassospira povalilytica]|uniref:Uncharacterized protein n=1 Tax=Thalassospira povalilytica TaxID=732237 RepID=A0ABX4R3A6_9PROT|nr:hypothetical protein CU041_19300 [Thalassospira povalilytica]